MIYVMAFDGKYELKRGMYQGFMFGPFVWDPPNTTCINTIKNIYRFIYLY